MEDDQQNNQRNKLHLQRKKLSKQILVVVVEIHQDQIKLLQRSNKNLKIKITSKNSNNTNN